MTEKTQRPTPREATVEFLRIALDEIEQPAERDSAGRLALVCAVMDVADAIREATASNEAARLIAERSAAASRR